MNEEKFSGKADVYDELKRLFEKYQQGGSVDAEYKTECFLGKF